MLETIVFIRPTFLILTASLVLLSALLYQRKPVMAFSRLGLTLVIFVFIGLLDYLLLDTTGLTTALEPLLHLAAIVLFGMVLFRLDLSESFYYGTWCYLLSRIFSQLLLPSLSHLSNSPFGMVFKLFIYLFAEGILYFPVRWLLGQTVSIGREGPARKQSLLMAASILTASLIFADHHFLIWMMYGTTTVSGQLEQGSVMIGIFRIVFDALCIAVLYLQCGLEHARTVEQELFTTRQLWQHQQSQYEHSLENIELINQKCHNMKYQIRALRSIGSSKELEEQIKGVEQSIMIYDSTIKTGNPVLDTVLTEKSLFCEKHSITLTCMADGDGLSFMSGTDLYTILGNALDNAIENVIKYPEPEKRIIQVSILPQGALHVIRVRNYCETEPTFVDGLPISTKENNGYHGFGLKSIRMIAEQYNGSLTCSWEEKSFLLLILLSTPAQEE